MIPLLTLLTLLNKLYTIGGAVPHENLIPALAKPWESMSCLGFPPILMSEFVFNSPFTKSPLVGMSPSISTLDFFIYQSYLNTLIK